MTLAVPADALEANGVGGITAEGNGTFDISLTGHWRGRLQVTIPLANSSDIVMHLVGGLWMPEGSAPGQSTVTVTHLSLFAPLSSLGSKIANALCFKQNPVKFLNCLLGKGLEYVDKSIVQALLGKALNECESSLLAEADSGSVGKVLIGTLIKIFTGPCVGQAGEGDWTPPVTGTPSLPSNGGPIQGGNAPIQGGSPPLQGGPAPTPTLTATGSGSQLLVQLANFPTGTTYFFCHVGTGYPTGGAIASHSSVDITSPNENLDALCSGSGNFWIGFQGTDGHDYYSNQVTLNAAAQTSATATGSGSQLLIQLANFPTGTTYFFCHVGTGYPTGGAIASHSSVDITSPNENLGALCSGSGNFWIGFQGTDGHDYYSNQVPLG